MGLLRLGDKQKPINYSIYDPLRQLTEGQRLVPTEVTAFFPSSRNIIQGNAAVEGTTETTILQVLTGRKALITEVIVVFKLAGAVGSGFRVRLTTLANVAIQEIYEFNSGAFNPGALSSNVISVKFPFYMENGEKLRCNGLVAGDQVFVNATGIFIK